MYLLHNSASFAHWHQLVRTLIPTDAHAHFLCHAVLFQLWCGGDVFGRNIYIQSDFLCVLLEILSFVRQCSRQTTIHPPAQR